jgi:translocation and assembly module TamB
VERLVTLQTQNLGLPPADVTATGRLADRRSTLDATVRAAGAGTMRITGAVPLRGDGLDLAIQGRIDLGRTTESLSAAGRRVTGNASVNMRVKGSLKRPDVNGTATVSGATYTDAALGIRLTAIDGRLSAQGTSIAIERLAARTPDNGSISAQGSIRIDPASGFPGTIQISGRRAKLIANDTVTAVANLSLSLAGPLARRPQISGRIDVVSLDVSIPERLPAEISPIEGTRHVAPTQTALARLSVERQARARSRNSLAFDATLDLTVSAPNRVFIRGRGIDAELGGDVRLRGLLSAPATIG